MTRRQLLALAASSLPLTCVPLAAAAALTSSRKKGLCLTTRNRPPEELNRFLKSVGAKWLYNWNFVPPDPLPEGIEYVPMIFKDATASDDAFARLKSISRDLGCKELLGFNEPDAKSQGNTSVEKALELWPKLEATGLRLGSPGCVHPDNEWMTAFMKGVDDRGLRVDYVCVHSYGGPSADALVKRLEKIHALYKRPIWITEFAVADWQAKSPAENRHKPDKIADFVTKLLPKLEAMDIVERYCWFHGGVDSKPLANSALFNPDGSLTIVGEAYRSVG